MKKTSKVILVLVLTGWLGYRFILYGSLFRSCIYTEKNLPVPTNLMNGKILSFKDSYIASGKDSEHACLTNLSAITLELVEPGIIANITVGKVYFEKNGQKIIDMKAGSKEFTVKKMVSVTKHGISTIDSGPGPINYLILTDSQGADYKIATVGLGINEKDRFLKLVSKNGEVILKPIDFY